MDIDQSVTFAEQAWCHALHRRAHVVRETMTAFPGVPREQIERLYERAIAETTAAPLRPTRPVRPAARPQRRPTPPGPRAAPRTPLRLTPAATRRHPPRDWAPRLAIAGIVLALLGIVDRAAHASGTTAPAAPVVVVAGE